MTVTRVPAARPTTWGYPLPIGSPEDLDLDNDAEVVRTWCLAVDDPHAAMPERCTLVAGHTPGHTWERDTITAADTERCEKLTSGAEAAASEAARLAAQRREDEERMHAGLVDTPSGVLPVRVPGEALRAAQNAQEDEGGHGEPGDAAGPLESAYPRPLLGRWVC
jgi:hypothetical protein